MKAVVLKELKQPLAVESRPDLEPGSGEVVIQLQAAALNRRDYWITQGLYPGIQTPIILGSDGAGTVVRCGPEVESTWQGREVIINPGWHWGDCESSQSDQFRILGLPDDGTFAEQVKVPAACLHAKPGHLPWPAAAALPLAGVTAFRALFSQGRLQPGESVLINGVGGGVAGMALLFAMAAKSRVFVTSSSDDKLAHAVKLGASAGFNYRAEQWHRDALQQHGPMDVIIDSAGGDSYARLIELAAPGGRIVNYGATNGPPPQLDLFKVFWKQLHLIGSTMGSPADFAAMLKLVDEHQLQPIVDHVYPLQEATQARQCLKDSTQFGKVVLSMS